MVVLAAAHKDRFHVHIDQLRGDTVRETQAFRCSHGDDAAAPCTVLKVHLLRGEPAHAGNLQATQSESDIVRGVLFARRLSLGRDL
jgi:hypothetical protein